MRLIDIDTIQWTANGCGHPNCKDICDYTKDDGTCCGWLVAHKRDVDNLPTVDAVPVVHAHWIRCESTGEVKCSACNDLAGVTSCTSDFCSLHALKY